MCWPLVKDKLVKRTNEYIGPASKQIQAETTKNL